MDINSNQQINTFLKGMNTDVSDALIDSSQYRYAENLRLVTNTESNSGELRPIEGTTPFEYSKGDIKAMTSIRDILIVVTKDDKIWKNNTASGGSWICIYEPKTWSDEEVPDDDERESKNKNESFGEYLSLVTRWESPKLVKLYIADGKHPLMYVNIITGESESVDQESESSAISGVDGLLSDVDTFLSPISAQLSSQQGSLKPTKVQYVYRLYKLGGASTTLSAASNVITLYKEYEPTEGYTNVDETTNKAIDLVIPASPTEELDYLQIYRITYVQVGQLPEVALIYDEKYTSLFTDVGIDVEESTLTELVSLIKLNIIPKVIESKNDYLFAANIKYKDNKIDEALSGGFSDFTIARAYSSGDFENQTAPENVSQYKDAALSYNEQFNSSNILNYDEKYWNKPNSNDPGGEGEYISWRYIRKSVFIDIKNNKYEDVERQLIIKDLVHSLRSGEVYRYGAVFYDKDGMKSSVYWIADIMAPYTAQSGSSVPGFSIPQVYNYASDNPLYGMELLGIRFSVNKLPEGCVGVEIVRAPRSVSDKITITQGIAGFPFRIYSRKTWDDDAYENTGMICPNGYMSTLDFNMVLMKYMNDIEDEYTASNNPYLSIGLTTNNYLMFASPEYVYLPDDIQNILTMNKSKLFILTRYEASCDTEILHVDSESDTYNQSSVYESVDLVRTKSYDEKSDHSYWYSLVSEDKNEGTEEHPRIVKKDTWQFDINAARNSVAYAYAQERSKLIFEQDSAKSFPVSVSNLPLRIDSESDVHTIKINTLKYPNVPDWNKLFDDQGNCLWNDALTNIETGTSYIGWSTPTANKYSYFSEDIRNNSGDGFKEKFRARYPVYYPIGSTGKCIVISIAEPMEKSYSSTKMKTPVVEIRKQAVPYGGTTTIDYSSYIQYGNIIDINGENSRYVDVYDGDCFPGVFTYNASHSWYYAGPTIEAGSIPQGVRNTTIYHVPVLSDIDLSATYGDLYSRLSVSAQYYVLDVASDVNGKFIQEKDAYLYNTAYGIEPTAIQYQSSKITSIDSSECDCRVHHSQLKTNGEHIDNWLNFKDVDFLDVDSRFGEITNMRLFKDKMIYWQNNATGILSINERTIVNDLDENQIILGTGDVLQRYDYISTVYGMKKEQYEAEVLSNTTQYWWDGYNKEILGYSGGAELVPLTKLKNVTNYINTNEEIEHPSLSYDIKFNELMASVVNNYTLAYNEQIQQFTSVYTFNPVYRATINNELFVTDKNSIYKWNTKPASTSVLFGQPANPLVRYTVNSQNAYVKVFDISTFGGRFYGGDEGIDNLTFTFKTPLKQESMGTGSSLITNREYDFRLDIPRNDNSSYGDRMRGKTMQCELKSSSNSTDFSLQYIITKYRMSWS